MHEWTRSHALGCVMYTRTIELDSGSDNFILSMAAAYGQHKLIYLKFPAEAVLILRHSVAFFLNIFRLHCEWFWFWRECWWLVVVRTRLKRCSVLIAIRNLTIITIMWARAQCWMASRCRTPKDKWHWGVKATAAPTKHQQQIHLKNPHASY